MTQEEKIYKVRFRSLVKDGEYYSLDGSMKISNREYMKGIKSISELTNEEQIYLLKNNETLFDIYYTTLHKFSY